MSGGGIGLGAGVGIGLLDGLMAQKKDERERELQAKTALWSPWTRIEVKQPHVNDSDSLLSYAMAGGQSGYKQGSRAEAAGAQDQAQADYLRQLMMLSGGGGA